MASSVKGIAIPSSTPPKLVARKPRQPLGNMHVGFGKTELLKRQHHKAGGITIAVINQGCIVIAFPRTRKRRQAPAAIRSLLGEHFVDQFFLFCCRNQAWKVRRRPKQGCAIHEGLSRRCARKVVAQQLDVRLNSRLGAIVLRGNSNGNRCKASAVKDRVGRFPRFVAELDPRPSTFVVSSRFLCFPHVTKRKKRVRTDFAALFILPGQYQCIQNCFGSTRLIVHPGIIWRNLAPLSYAFGDVSKQSSLGGRRSRLADRSAQSGPGERVRESSMAGNAKGLPVPSGSRPTRPSSFAMIKVGCSPIRIPSGSFGGEHEPGDCCGKKNGSGENNQACYGLAQRRSSSNWVPMAYRAGGRSPV